MTKSCFALLLLLLLFLLLLWFEVWCMNHRLYFEKQLHRRRKEMYTLTRRKKCVDLINSRNETDNQRQTTTNKISKKKLLFSSKCSVISDKPKFLLENRLLELKRQQYLSRKHTFLYYSYIQSTSKKKQQSNRIFKMLQYLFILSLNSVWEAILHEMLFAFDFPSSALLNRWWLRRLQWTTLLCK